MPQTTTSHAPAPISWVHRDLYDADGRRIGRIADVYLDVNSGRPSWLAVDVARLGRKIRFVPLEAAHQDGDVVVTPHTRKRVKDSPRAEPTGRLEPDEEDALNEHYGSRGTHHADRGTGTNEERERENVAVGRRASDAPARSH